MDPDAALGGVILFEAAKHILELASTIASLAFFWFGALVLWRYNRLLKSMRTCERCGREVLNRTASHCGRCGHQLSAAA